MRVKCERHQMFVSIKRDTIYPMHDDDTICVIPDMVMDHLFGEPVDSGELLNDSCS